LSSRPQSATMCAMDLGFLGVIIGAAIAGSVSIGAEVLRTHRDASLDAKRRADDRRLASDAMQRETLLKLQKALLTRVIGLAAVPVRPTAPACPPIC
jgi:hypothetical protein